MIKQTHFFLLFLFLMSCASPQKSFNKGDYAKAYKSALKNLKKGKKNRKDKTILNKSFQQIYDEKQADIASLMGSSFIEDWELAYKEYGELIDYYDDGRQYLDDKYSIKMKFVDEDSKKLGDDIALSYYELGLDQMALFRESNNKLHAQDANVYFQKVVAYGGAQADLDALLQVSYEQGIVQILVEAYAPFEQRYNWEIDRQFSDIERESSGFYVYSYERVLTEPDCSMQIDLSSIDRRVDEDRNFQTFTEQIQDGYDSRTDTSGVTTRVPRYIDVQGQVTTISENITYRWRAAVSFRGNREYCDFRSRNFEAEEIVRNERYELSGDQRAIPDRYNRDNYSSEDQDDIVDELLDDLYRDIRRSYF